jgi:hypothetical protein
MQCFYDIHIAIYSILACRIILSAKYKLTRETLMVLNDCKIQKHLYLLQNPKMSEMSKHLFTILHN